MKFTETAIAGVKLIQPRRHADARGFFSEVFRKDLLERHGVAADFVQDNQSLSREAGTVRGLHFQVPPFAQAKLVRVVAGAAIDVAVDIRRGSPSFGQHVAVRLSAEDGNQIFIPEGFAHGFCTLEPDTELFYKVTRYYSAEHDRGLRWNDPALAIDWPVAPGEARLSERDLRHPGLSDLPDFFAYPPPAR